jgi:hypothetical protein
MSDVSDCKSAHPGSIPGVASNNPQKTMRKSGATNAERETNAERAGTKTDTSFLYVMWTGTITMPRSKIGHSVRPMKRRSQLDQGAPFEIKLEWQWEVPRHRARELEQKVHQLLANRRVRGEWFRIPSYTARDAVQEVLTDAGIIPRGMVRNLDTGEVKEAPRLKSRFPLP